MDNVQQYNQNNGQKTKHLNTSTDTSSNRLEIGFIRVEDIRLLFMELNQLLAQNDQPLYPIF